jgi:translocation and assembly module TamB
MDLGSQKISIDDFILENTEITLNMAKTEIMEDGNETSAPFEWPNWEITINELDFTDNSAIISSATNPPIEFEDLTLKLENIAYQPGNINLELLESHSPNILGLHLVNFQFKAALSENEIAISRLQMETPYSNIHSDISITYTNFASFLDDPLSGNYDLNIHDLYLGPEDLLWAGKEFSSDTSLWWADQAISLETELKFSNRSAEIESFKAKRGESTTMSLDGKVTNPLNTNNMFVHESSLSIETLASEWSHFLPDSLSLNIPDSLKLSVQANGPIKELNSELALNTPDGSFHLLALLGIHSEEINFSGNLSMEDIQLGKILKQADMGQAQGNFQFEGSNSEKNGTNANINGSFNQLELYGYDYNALNTTINLKDSLINAELHHDNRDLEMDLYATAVLDSLLPSYSMNIDLRGADLQALNLSSKDMKLRINSKAGFTGNINNFDAFFDLSEGLIVKDGSSYDTGNLELTANANDSLTELSLNSEFMEANFDANAPPLEIIAAINNHLKNYLDKTKPEEDTISGVKLNGRLDVHQTRLLTEVILPGLNHLDPLTFEIEFDQDSGIFNSELSVPRILYNEAELSNLIFFSESNLNSMDFNLNFERLSAGPINIFQTVLTGDFFNNELNLDLLIEDENENDIFHLASQIISRNDSLSIHIIPENIIMSSEIWTIPDDNVLIFSSPEIFANNFSLRNNEQNISLNTELADGAENHLGIFFENFQLSTLTRVLNPDNPPAEGELEGRIIIDNPLEKPGFIAGMSITQLKVLDQILGTLDVDAENTSPGEYVARVGLSGDYTDIKILANLSSMEEGTNSSAEISINKLGLNVLEGLLTETIDNASGELRGEFTFENNPDTMLYSGNINFHEASMLIKPLNNTFTFSNDPISLNNSGLYFDKFIIEDPGGNIFEVRGNVLTENISNPELNIDIIADNFLLLNSSAGDNELFYGKALLDARIRVTGNISQPLININGKLNEGTDITIVLPEQELDLIEREGVVEMVNMLDPDDIMTRTEERRTVEGLSGMEIRSVMAIGPDVTFRIIIDERSGDYLEITGEADVSFDLNRNGEMVLSGIYELSSGIYEVSLYNIVSRKLELEKGSRISWSGDPLGAALDLRAVYRVRTSAGDLMADQLTGADASVRMRYRQELPFDVYLNIKGTLMQPDISFALDMPENQRGALDGTVYNRVQQLNNTESELNRQVFGLLVLGRFFPEGGSSVRESETAESRARSSVSQMLSKQLNSLTDRHIKGVELDLNLDSYTDYQSGSAQDRTQLNVNLRKNLFSDRVIVQVGSSVDLEGRPETETQGVADIIGDVSLEYLLTEDGRFRLRGFRKNEFEGFVEGQLVVTGISLIFNKEFNKWKEAFIRQKETGIMDLSNAKIKSDSGKEDKE